MVVLVRPWGHQHFVLSGGTKGLAVMWLNSLGTDLRMWDLVRSRTPEVRSIGMDKRGHGLSATPASGWSLADLADDALALLDHLAVDRAMVAGCSIGGMIAQALAVRAPERIAGLVLSNTAMKIGSSESWTARIDAIRAGGMAGLAPQIIERWFGARFRATPEVKPWETMLLRCDPEGYVGTCRVLADADLRAESPGIRCPVLVLGGSEDLATPVSLVAETAAAIPGSELRILDGSGHIPAVDAPDVVAELVSDFYGRLA